MNEQDSQLVKSGVPGIDHILRGGFPPKCVYMVAGSPGSGKTTLAMQFLLEGVKAGEKCLYVTLSESLSEIESIASSHGWDLSGLVIHELIPGEQALKAESQLTVFNPSELELSETTDALIKQINKHHPQRVVIDSLSELRLVAQSALRYRRQILALKQYFAGQSCTVLFLDDLTGDAIEGHLESIAHGVIHLEQNVNQYGSERRRLRVSKLRGVGFRGGYHDFVIRRGGLDVFPRLIAAEHRDLIPDEDHSSGNSELDKLLCGGIPAGTSTLLLGPAGTGKSTVATQFVVAAAERGLRSAVFLFDENLGTYFSRSRKLGLDLEPYVEKGLLTIQQVDPAELSSGEFAVLVQRCVESNEDSSKQTKLVIIDSLNGYLNAMPEERFLTAQLHELLAYLGQQGVVSFMSATQSGMVGTAVQSTVDATYLADNVILFRYFEAMGNVRRAISIVKKRSGKHETTIREMRVSSKGIEIGEPLRNFQGVLTGVPTYLGDLDSLQKSFNDAE